MKKILLWVALFVLLAGCNLSGNEQQIISSNIILSYDDTSTSEAETSNYEIDVEDTGNRENWKEAYLNELNNWNWEFRYAYVEDISNDGVPEVFISWDMKEPRVILAYADNGFSLFSPMWWSSFDCYMYYCKETNQIITKEVGGHTVGTTGFLRFAIYDWTQDGYVQSYLLKRDTGYLIETDGEPIKDENGYIVVDETRKCYINNDKVTIDEYEDAFVTQILSLDLRSFSDDLVCYEDVDLKEYILTYII